jgi:nitroreductase
MLQADPDVTHQIVRETIYARRSVRKYEQRPVPEDLINDLLESAFAAPFSAGCHALRVMILRDRRLLASLSDDMKACAKDFLKKERFLRLRIPFLYPMGIVPLFRYSRVLAQFKAAIKAEQDLWWGAPTLLLACAQRDASPTYEIDVSAAMENITLMATACGLGTCIVKTPELINYYSALRSSVHLPEGWWVIVGVCVGYPLALEGKEKRPSRPRITNSEYVQWYSKKGAG